MKIALAALVLCVPAVVGSAAAAAATAGHVAPQAQLFSWVPAGGFPDPFPFGQCTWWAAYNHRVTWGGNAAEWLVNARAHGLPTSQAPSLGAIAVFEPGGAYSRYGHVAIVIAVSSTSYTVSEMNAFGWGRVSTRAIASPDPHVQGFIPVAEAEAR